MTCAIVALEAGTPFLALLLAAFSLRVADCGIDHRGESCAGRKRKQGTVDGAARRCCGKGADQAGHVFDIHGVAPERDRAPGCARCNAALLVGTRFCTLFPAEASVKIAYSIAYLARTLRGRVSSLQQLLLSGQLRWLLLDARRTAGLLARQALCARAAVGFVIRRQAAFVFCVAAPAKAKLVLWGAAG
jgi:hypothetical protein